MQHGHECRGTHSCAKPLHLTEHSEAGGSRQGNPLARPTIYGVTQPGSYSAARARGVIGSKQVTQPIHVAGADKAALGSCSNEPRSMLQLELNGLQLLVQNFCGRLAQLTRTEALAVETVGCADTSH